RRRPTPLPPAEITSCIEAPRIAPGLCSPSAQRTASVMFDLPEPLGPTMTLTTGENSSLARSGHDLNPFISIDLRYISLTLARTPDAAQRLLGGLLLGHLLASAPPPADALVVDDRGDFEPASVRGPRFADHLVAYARPALREQLLKRRLEVHRR